MTDSFLRMLPGIFENGTRRSSKNRWVEGLNVRFFDGIPETSGGSVAVSEEAFLGMCRGLMPFQALTGNDYLALGTHIRFYVEDKEGALTNVTPIRTTGTLGTDPITTLGIGLYTVSIADTGHGLSAGDWVDLDGATAVGGITVDGEYDVTSVTDADNYVITHSAAATSVATGGGASVTYSYELPIGLADSEVGAGWGAGVWSSSTHGWSTPDPSAGVGIIPARVWAICSWGEDFIAAPINGTAYHFDTSAGILSSNRLAVIANAPDTMKNIFSYPDVRHIIALGAHDGSVDDPLLIRWCSAEDFNDWTPAYDNSAGDHRVNLGNEIVTADFVLGTLLVLTDLAAYAMSYNGYPTFFGVQFLEKNCGACSPRAIAVFGGRAFWKGFRSFWQYDGAVRELPCDVQESAFDVNELQIVKTFTGVNADFSEIWFFKVSSASTEIDSVEIYDVANEIWWIGDDIRTSYIDRSNFDGKPIATGSDGLTYRHEVGADNNGVARTKRLVSYEAQPDDGESVTRLHHFYPDFDRLTGTVTVTVTARRRPNSDARTKTAIFTTATEKVSPRIRGGQMSITLESSALGDDWRMADIGIDVTLHGKR